MALNDLPAALQSVIQTGMLERRFREPLVAKLGFRAIADREPFMAKIGETITKTRTGLLAPVTTPMAAASVTDITSGLTPDQYAVEQYVLGVAQYAKPMMLNVVTAEVAIDSLFLRNAWTLGENAHRSVDGLARDALFASYIGGNTRVRTALGSASTTVQVDDIRGFTTTLNTLGQPVPVSSSFPVTVTIGNTGYSLVGAVADGSSPAGGVNPWDANVVFSNSGSNVSTTPGGRSGTLTFSSNVATGDATLAAAVVSSVAPLVIRPSLVASPSTQAPTTAAISQANDVNNGRLTMQMILEAKATMSANSVPPHEESGLYVCWADPIQLTGLYQDPAFQQFFRGKPDSKEYKKGVVAELLGVRIEETNMNPVQTTLNTSLGAPVRRAVLCGQGALVEGVFTRKGYEQANKVDDGNLTTVVDDIAHITREPIDALKQVVTQSWSYIGGFVAPTDTTANPSVLPTATNSAYKRAIVLESL
jgi:hypothetical protein